MSEQWLITAIALLTSAAGDYEPGANPASRDHALDALDSAKRALKKLDELGLGR